MDSSDRLQFFAATDVGRKRSHNEDNFLVDKSLGLYVLADGMGGHAAGEIASAIAVRTVHEVVAAQREMLEDLAKNGPRADLGSKEVEHLLDYAIQCASQRIHAEAQADRRKRGMGTTTSLLLVCGSMGYVAHVGDSRVYLLRGDALNQITEDHTVANELLRLGMVTEEELVNVPRKNAITRAVGVYSHAEVDTLTLDILPGDQFLLCSDGLSGYVDDTKEDLRNFLTARGGDRVVKALVDFANEKGGKDNITTVLVRFTGDVTDSTRARRLELKREMLASMPLFSRLNERELLRVMQVAEVHQYAAGKEVITEGEFGEQMFVILDGELEVKTGNAVLGLLGPGEHIGEMALIRSRPRSASAITVRPSELISLSRGDFFDVIRSEPRIAVKLLWQFLGVIANRLEQTSRDLSDARDADDDDTVRGSWIEDEPTLDPFVQPREAVSRLSFHPPSSERMAPLSAEVEMRPDAPSFDNAPAMAERVGDPPLPRRQHSTGDPPLPRRQHSTGDPPLPRRQHRTGDPPLPRRQHHTGDPPEPRRQHRTGDPPEPDTPRRGEGASPAAAAAAAAAEFDPKATVPRVSNGSRPSRPRPERDRGKRERQETLKSADSLRAFELLGDDLPEVLGSDADTTPVSGPVAETTPKPRAATRPNRPARKKRHSARDKSTLPDGKGRRKRARAVADLIADSVGDDASEDESDQKKTVSIAANRKKEDRFQATKNTIPLEPPDSLRNELDALRKEYKERLKKSRKARGDKDSD